MKLDEMDLNDILRTFHPNVEECIENTEGHYSINILKIKAKLYIVIEFKNYKGP